MNDLDPNADIQTVSGAKGAFADGLTLLRVVLTPAIMLTIILGWQSEPGLAGDAELYRKMLAASVLATVLFGFAALSDVLDDAIGGAETSGFRKFGWFDDIADTILVVGTLAALLWATWQAGALGLGLAIPAIVIIARELIIGLTKGYELTRTGWPQTSLGTAKNALAMLATLLLVASPWLTSFIDSLRVNADNVMEVYGEPSNLVWNVGLIALWVTAILSIVTAVMLLSRKSLPNLGDVDE